MIAASRVAAKYLRGDAFDDDDDDVPPPPAAGSTKMEGEGKEEDEVEGEELGENVVEVAEEVEELKEQEQEQKQNDWPDTRFLNAMKNWDREQEKEAAAAVVVEPEEPQEEEKGAKRIWKRKTKKKKEKGKQEEEEEKGVKEEQQQQQEEQQEEQEVNHLENETIKIHDLQERASPIVFKDRPPLYFKSLSTKSALSMIRSLGFASTFASHVQINLTLEHQSELQRIIGCVRTVEGLATTEKNSPDLISFRVKSLPAGKPRAKTQWKKSSSKVFAVVFILERLPEDLDTTGCICIRLYGKSSKIGRSREMCYGECVVPVTYVLESEKTYEATRLILPMAGNSNAFQPS